MFGRDVVQRGAELLVAGSAFAACLTAESCCAERVGAAGLVGTPARLACLRKAAVVGVVTGAVELGLATARDAHADAEDQKQAVHGSPGFWVQKIAQPFLATFR